MEGGGREGVPGVREWWCDHPAIWAIGHRQAIRERSGQLAGGRGAAQVEEEARQMESM